MTDTFTLRTVEGLLRALDEGARPKYVLSWGHHPNSDGSIGMSCFSQWFEARFQVDGQPEGVGAEFSVHACEFDPLGGVLQ